MQLFLLTYHLADGERAVLTAAFWEKLKEKSLGEMILNIYSKYIRSRSVIKVCVLVCMSIFVCDFVPQWYCGQQFPAMAACTRERPGAQLTDDSGHRLTSQTVPTHKKRKRDFEDTVTEAHMFSNWHSHHNSNEDSSCRCCWYPQPGFLRVNTLELVQYMTHTLLRQETRPRKIQVCWHHRWRLERRGMWREYATVGKLTAQVSVAARLFSSHLHEELIVPAAGSRHGRARCGVTLWGRPITAAFGESSQGNFNSRLQTI